MNILTLDRFNPRVWLRNWLNAPSWAERIDREQTRKFNLLTEKYQEMLVYGPQSLNQSDVSTPSTPAPWPDDPQVAACPGCRVELRKDSAIQNSLDATSHAAPQDHGGCQQVP